MSYMAGHLVVVEGAADFEVAKKLHCCGSIAAHTATTGGVAAVCCCISAVLGYVESVHAAAHGAVRAAPCGAADLSCFSFMLHQLRVDTCHLAGGGWLCPTARIA